VNQWSVLGQAKRNNDIAFAKLPLQIDLLSRLDHSNRGKDFPRGRRWLAVDRQAKCEINYERFSHGKEALKCPGQYAIT